MSTTTFRNIHLEQNNNCKLFSFSHQEFMMDVQLILVRTKDNSNVPMFKSVLKAWKRFHNTDEKNYGVIK